MTKYALTEDATIATNVVAGEPIQHVECGEEMEDAGEGRYICTRCLKVGFPRQTEEE